MTFDIHQGYTLKFIKAVPDTVLDMINAVYHDIWYSSGLYVEVYQGCFWHCIRHNKCRLSWQVFDIHQGYTFKFIKALSDTVLDMIKTVYHDKPLISSGLRFGRSSSPILRQWGNEAFAYYNNSDLKQSDFINKYRTRSTDLTLYGLL